MRPNPNLFLARERAMRALFESAIDNPDSTSLYLVPRHLDMNVFLWRLVCDTMQPLSVNARLSKVGRQVELSNGSRIVLGCMNSVDSYIGFDYLNIVFDGLEQCDEPEAIYARIRNRLRGKKTDGSLGWLITIPR